MGGAALPIPPKSEKQRAGHPRWGQWGSVEMPTPPFGGISGTASGGSNPGNRVEHVRKCGPFTFGPTGPFHHAGEAFRDERPA